MRRYSLALGVSLLVLVTYMPGDTPPKTQLLFKIFGVGAIFMAVFGPEIVTLLTWRTRWRRKIWP